MGWLAGLVPHSAGCGQAPDAGCSGSASASSASTVAISHRVHHTCRPTGDPQDCAAGLSGRMHAGSPVAGRRRASGMEAAPLSDCLPSARTRCQEAGSPAWLTHAAQQRAAMSPGTAAIHRHADIRRDGSPTPRGWILVLSLRDSPSGRTRVPGTICPAQVPGISRPVRSTCNGPGLRYARRSQPMSVTGGPA
jgi:hypothetical protein